MGGVVFHTCDLAICSKAFQHFLHQRGLNPGAGESGIVINHDTNVNGLCQLFIVGIHPIFHGDEVIGQDHLYAVSTNFLGKAAEFDGLVCAGAAGAADDGYSTVHFFHADLHNPLVFLVGQVGELAIAAAGSQGAVFKILNLINQPADILAIPLIVNIAIFLERRDCHVAHAAFFQMPL